MSLYHGEQVFSDDGSYTQLVGDGVKVWADGEFRYLSAQPPPLNAAEIEAGFSREFGDVLTLIPRSEWSERLKEQERLQARVSDHQDFPAYDQNGTNYCWANGPCQAVTTMRRMQGLPLRVISSASVGGPITGYRNVGGWEGNALDYLAKEGGVGTDIWPNNTINRSYGDKPEVKADRQNHKALEWIKLGNDFDKYATACLLGYPCAVAYNWWSHVVMICDLVEISSGRFGLRIRNSHGVNWGEAPNKHGQKGYAVFAEGKGTPSSGFCLRQVTGATK